MNFWVSTGHYVIITDKERFRELDLAVLPDKFDRKAIQKALSKHDIEIKLFELRPARDARVCTMMAWSKRPRGAGEGFVNGYGCASDIRAAAGGAAYECLRTAAAVYVGGARPEQPFESLKRPGSSWYHFWAVQTKECQDYFHENLAPLPGVSDRVAPEALESGDVPIERIDRLNSLFPDIPLVIAQAKPGKLIKPQFGVFYHDEAFVARLRGFCGRPVHPDFSVPHFYG